MARRHAERARAMVGTRFRSHGRDPRFGLDCVGLAALTFNVPADRLPTGYRLRGSHEERLRETLGRFMRRVPPWRAVAGDLLLLRVAGDQLHLAVKTEAGFVHADAGRRRVLEVPGMPQWDLLATYRARRKVGA